MRRSTRKAYHEKVDSVLKREKQIKGIRIADSYLNSNSRDFWKEAELLRGQKGAHQPLLKVSLMATILLMHFQILR